MGFYNSMVMRQIVHVHIAEPFAIKTDTHSVSVARNFKIYKQNISDYKLHRARKNQLHFSNVEIK